MQIRDRHHHQQTRARQDARLALISAAAALLLATNSAAAEGLEQLRMAISAGKPSLDARLRWEQVDQANSLRRADALTVRGRLGYSSGQWNELDAQLEYEGTAVIGGQEFNSSRNGRTAYSVIADPGGNELNQAWLRYAGLPLKTTAKYGRQRLIFDNARYLGNVGWRQNEQTFDGALVSNSFLPKTTVDLAHISNVNSFTGTDISMRGEIIRIGNTALPYLNLVAYGYLFDYRLNNANRQDTQTLGLRTTGTETVRDFKLAYALEYARQRDYGQSSPLVNADYWLAELSASYKPIACLKAPALKLGFEVLGGDGRYGFQTPLASLHAFQGWADQFLNTPATGIRDFYAGSSATVEKIALQVLWHDYRSDSGSRHYGSEWNLHASRPLAEGLTVGIKYADYHAKDFSVNTRKAWAWLEYKF